MKVFIIVLSLLLPCCILLSKGSIEFGASFFLLQTLSMMQSTRSQNFVHPKDAWIDYFLGSCPFAPKPLFISSIHIHFTLE